MRTACDHVDERLTTVEANRTLMESGVRRENRSKYVDMIAAVFICRAIWMQKQTRVQFDFSLIPYLDY